MYENMLYEERIKKLSQEFGTCDLLMAYVMRELSCDYETAVDIAYLLTDDLDRWIHGINEEVV